MCFVEFISAQDVWIHISDIMSVVCIDGRGAFLCIDLVVAECNC